MREPSDFSFPSSSMVPASLCSSTAIETSRYRLDGASKPAITCLSPQCPSHHLSPFTLLLIAHLITTDLTITAGVCCRVAEKRIKNIYLFSQHKCVKVCSQFYEAWSKTAAFTKSWGVNCWALWGGSCQPTVSLWTGQHTGFCVGLKQVLGRKLFHGGRWDRGRDFLKF